MARPDRRRTIVAAVLSVTVSLIMAGVTAVALRAGDGTVARDDPVRVVPALALPPPRTDGETSLEQAILRRGSVREFDPEPLTLGQLGQLLWAAQGQREQGRTAPSAGGLYPLEIYVAHEGGVYHYRPPGHEVAAVSSTDIRDDLAAAALDQRAFHTAPAVIAIAGVEERTARKYGARAERYVVIEVGHAAQNVLLQAAVLGVGAVPTGAFDDAAVADLFGMPDGTELLYLIPVGRPA
ncbi:MAG TPA: SagB/ThcOx family dehydrogenase [Euzebyales bacterium]|nr:SagB/ThcOx family dehydrogenase [Euzebyales bacterium]